VHTSEAVIEFIVSVQLVTIAIHYQPASIKEEVCASSVLVSALLKPQKHLKHPSPRWEGGSLEHISDPAIQSIASVRPTMIVIQHRTISKKAKDV